MAYGPTRFSFGALALAAAVGVLRPVAALAAPAPQTGDAIRELHFESDQVPAGGPDVATGDDRADVEALVDRHAVPSAPEAAPLGQPNSLFSARPAERSRRGLAALDPRSNEITRVLAAMAVVLGLLLGLRAVLRRTGWGLLGAGGRPSGVVEILARYPLARGQQLILLKLARRVLLVHRAGSTMSTLSEVSDPDEVAALLGRVEAGSGEGKAADAGTQDDGWFGKVLKRSGAEHDRLAEGAMRLKGRRSGFTGAEVIDLTRRGRGAAV